MNLDVVAEHGQVVGGGQAGGAGSDDEDAVSGGIDGLDELPALLDGEVTEVTLDGVNGHCAVEVGAVAGHLAGVVADTTVDGREGVVGSELTPCLLLLMSLDETQPFLDVLARRATGITRREHVEVDGSAGAGRGDATCRAGEVRTCGDVLVLPDDVPVLVVGDGRVTRRGLGAHTWLFLLEMRHFGS